jgi:hypothetical protein
MRTCHGASALTPVSYYACKRLQYRATPPPFFLLPSGDPSSALRTFFVAADFVELRMTVCYRFRLAVLAFLQPAWDAAFPLYGLIYLLLRRATAPGSLRMVPAI